jgi:hypothetical protein
VVPASEIHDDLLVEALIYRAEGRRWLPEVEQAEFGISSDNIIYHQSQDLEAYE